jgi:uncharacterized protein YcfJ
MGLLGKSKKQKERERRAAILTGVKLGMVVGGAYGTVHGIKKDKKASTTKAIGKSILLGGGYSGYQRAREEGQGRLKAGVKAGVGRQFYSGAKAIEATKKKKGKK